MKAYNVQDNTVIAYSTVKFVETKENFMKKKDIPKLIFYIRRIYKAIFAIF